MSLIKSARAKWRSYAGKVMAKPSLDKGDVNFLSSMIDEKNDRLYNTQRKLSRLSIGTREKNNHMLNASVIKDGAPPTHRLGMGSDVKTRLSMHGESLAFNREFNNVMRKTEAKGLAEEFAKLKALREDLENQVKSRIQDAASKGEVRESFRNGLEKTYTNRIYNTARPTLMSRLKFGLKNLMRK